MNDTTARFFVFALCCLHPLFWSVVSVVAYKRYTEGGWRSVFGVKETK